MFTQRQVTHLLFLLVITLTAFVAHWLEAAANSDAPTTRTTPFGFGLAVAARDGERVQQIGFNWMLVYDPPHRREPVNVLYRVPVHRWSYDPNSIFGRWEFEERLYRLTGEHGDWIEAYEIGNEVNLYVNGWEAPPDAKAYVDLLCTAYHVIKVMDPTATVVSAGLAPVGRVSGNWQGHAGHNYLIQDEREYLREFLAAGGGDCVDTFGYHPLGFSATFDAAPDVDGGTPERNCANGFCFRGIEQIRAIIAASDYANKPVWATEVGWLAEPDDARCLNDYSWAGRTWQRVTRQKQAENMIGAFKHGYTEWPWLGAMFVFNLNFDQAPYYHVCEQMRYYSIQSSATETALQGMMQELFEFVYLPVIKQ